ncbi:MAG: DUF6799 domain-containing protein, partial [Adhaeribacter sp.]
MRTRFILFLLSICTLSLARAQAPANELNPGQLKDGFAMHQGRMIQIRDGQVTPLTRELRLPNGLKVDPRGMVSGPGKKRRKIAEGYVLNQDGHIVLLKDDMMRYEAIREHAQKIPGSADPEVIVTDDGMTVVNTPGTKSANNELLNRRAALVQERNVLIKQKADLLNKAPNKKAQQNSPEIRETDRKLQQL